MGQVGAGILGEVLNRNNTLTTLEIESDEKKQIMESVDLVWLLEEKMKKTALEMKEELW